MIFKLNIDMLVRMIYVMLLLLVACKTYKSDTLNSPDRIPVEEFFKNPQTEEYKLSPDGKYLSYLGLYEGHRNIFLKQPGTNDSVRLTDSKRDINVYFWVNNDNLIYYQDNNGDENYRLYRVAIGDASVVCVAGSDSGKVNAISRLSEKPDEIIITMNLRDPEIKDLYSLNIVDGTCTLIAENPGEIVSWMVDNKGELRIAIAAGGKILKWDKGTETFSVIFQRKSNELFDPCFFSHDNKFLYAYSDIGRDKVAIVEFDIDNMIESGVLLEHPVYDIFGDDERDHFTSSQKNNKLNYAQFTTEKRTFHFFDGETEKMYNKLQEKFKDMEIVFQSSSDDFTKHILEVSSDKHPGRYYFFDTDSEKVELIADKAPWIVEEEMSDMHPIEFTARDGLRVHGYLTLPSGIKPIDLPMVVFVHAGPQWRNSWGFDENVQFFANRGYAVLQVNYRGSTCYGKDFMKAGFKEWGLGIQNDITDGVLYMVSEGIADKERIAIFGWSYGGYAALCGATFTPDLYACAIDFWGFSNHLGVSSPPLAAKTVSLMYERKRVHS